MSKTPIISFSSTIAAWTMTITLALLPTLAASETRHFPKGAHAVTISQTDGIRSNLLTNIAPIIESSIAKGNYPGAVVLVGHRGHIIYRGVFGNKRIVPDIAPMRFDTIFDIASLSKVVVTTPAIMQLIEQGKIDLDAKVAAYWPEFAQNKKEDINIRSLLTHTSGLRDTIPSPTQTINKQDLLKQIAALPVAYPTGTKVVYSDTNFIILAHLIEIISKEPLDQYAKLHLFKPLNMQHTFFNPPSQYRDQIAPTEIIDKRLRMGVVHDPLAYALSGIAGHAGVFSNANDLGNYAQSLLNAGKLPDPYSKTRKRQTSAKYFLGPLSILKMTTPQTPENLSDARGLGWDIDSKYAARGSLLPTASYGHTGFTGTSIWIDPSTKTWIVILTSRTHPTPAKENELVKDRRLIANIVSASVTKLS